MVSILMALLSLISTGYAINRPVYKVVLTQKGFAQFIQYDVETPPLREFTFCTWIRIYELVNDQTIFSYIALGNNRVVRLWLDYEGDLLKLSINGRETGSHVDNMKDVWKHVCLSYQSDFGAWALYIDGRLLSCGMAQSLSGYVLPGGGSIIVGYGTDQNGIPNGLEGEIFGANMILKSTIDRNVTLRNDPTKRQKHFLRNKMKERNKGPNYIVFSDLQTDEVHNNYEMSSIPPFINFSQNYIQFSTPHSFIAHSVGSDLSKTRNIKARDKAITNTYLDFTVSDKDTTFWNTFHQDRPTTLSGLTIPKHTLTPLEIIGVPKISEFETPPPLETIKPDIYSTTTPRIIETYKIDEDFEGNTSYGKEVSREISLVETPPPPEKNNKVYGQWTSSKFASSVLNYLKSINFHKRENKKVPATIPLKKINDNFPYASELKHMKIRPPFQFLNKNVIEKRSDSNKRQPQINVKILENDLRSLILKSHGNTEVKNVEIMNRGESQNNINRKYRHADTNENDEISAEYHQPKSFTVPTEEYTHSSNTALDDSNLLSILPFLKSLEYFVKDSEDAESTKVVNNDMYLKSLSNKNKWHNIKTYNNDYTPRHINLDSNNNQDELKHKIVDENNNKYTSVRLKYISEGRVLNTDDPSILQGRTLAQEVSNRSNGILENVSINKYNHGYLPGHNKNIKIDDKHRSVIHGDTSITQTGNSFGRHVKLGNALNERHVLGDSEKQKEQSFVGGYDSIPDINRYRSDIDNESSSAKVPPSLGTRICKYTGLAEFKRVLYAKPDGSIDNTEIISPVKKKNIGIEFITQNYKTCSLADSYLENNEMLFIDWSKTPVRLFGGAYVKTTTDLCGFF